jgi:hypothetical protein
MWLDIAGKSGQGTIERSNGGNSLAACRSAYGWRREFVLAAR